MRRCMGCMEQYDSEFEICPYCGYEVGTPPEERIHLEPGMVLYNRYTVGRVLGYGGFGVTYIAWDGKLQQKVAIKEYMPGEFSTRMPGRSQVTVLGGDRGEQFEAGLKKFIEEARHLAQFQSEDGIVTVYDSFEENGTAYIIMEYLEGETLAQYLKREGTISEDKAIEMLLPVMESLEVVHKEGIIHRDIAPDNIFLTKDGKVKLIDFGASRYATTSHSRSLTVIIKPGYSPEEQYRSRGDQGPHTDVYALAATLYKMILGTTPPDAMERRAKFETEGKEILEAPHKLKKDISPIHENAILNALNIRIEDRTPDIPTFLAELNSSVPIKRKNGKIKKVNLYLWPIWLKILVPSLLIAFITLGALMLTGVINFSIFEREIVIPNNTVVVPDVEGMHYEEATTNLQSSQLRPIIAGNVEETYVGENVVVLQKPMGGTYLEYNSNVELTVSRERTIVGIVPYLIGSTAEEARKELETAGLTEIEEIEEYNDEVAEGLVCAQSLEKGTEVEEGMTLTITISKGSKPFTMPDLTGKTIDEADSILNELGLVRSGVTLETTNSYKAGQIIRHTPSSGATVRKGDSVSFVIAVAPTPTPKPTSTPTPRPTNTPTPRPTDTPITKPLEPVKDYTLNISYDSLEKNWNPHICEASILDYLSSPFVTTQAKNTKDGIYQWVYEMATEINDVTATHQDDLTKYPVKLPEGTDPVTVTEGYVFELKLNPNAKWQDGTPINADSYIYSMQQLLNPAMENSMAKLYCSGESAIAGGYGYYNSDLAGQPIYGDAAGLENVETYYLDLTLPSVFFDGNSAKNYYDVGYADYYKNADGVDLFAKLTKTVGYVEVNDDIIADLTVIAVNFGDSNPEAWKEFCFAVTGTYEETPWESVGLYKTDDYTIYYVMENQINYYYALNSFTSTWLVYEPYYEAGKNTSRSVFSPTRTIVATDYGTDVRNTMSFGPYKIESFQKGKQIIFTQNENWYGWEKQDNGALLSYTPYEVDGKHVQRYQTTKIVIKVMDGNASDQAFRKGDLDMINLVADHTIATNGASDRLYKADESYIMSFFFNTGLDALKEMDKSKGNENSIVLSNINFRKAFSLSINRREWVTVTDGYKPSLGLMNDLYYYDFYNNPGSSYRSSNEAMQAICDLYDVKYGRGTAYATLKDAYKSINGYNLTIAKKIMAQACKELVEAGLYKEGEEIKIRIAYSKDALLSADKKQIELINKYINAAVEGSGFGKITLKALGNINDRYGDVAKGEYAIGYGAWGGAFLYPFRNFRVYCDPDYVSIHEAGCWDPATETLTLTVNGQEVTKTWQAWSNSMTGAGEYAAESNELKLQITAQMETEYLKKYYRIPLATSTTCTMLSYKLDYYTPDYNLAYGWGGFELIKYNYDDAEWTAFVARHNGTLNYKY